MTHLLPAVGYELNMKPQTFNLYKRNKPYDPEYFYEAPQAPDVVTKTDTKSVEECVNKILNYLKEKQFIM